MTRRGVRASAGSIAALLLVLGIGSPAYGAKPASVGGWAGFLLSDNDQPNTHPTFDAHPWYLYVQAEPVDDWKFFGEIEAEHVFKLEGGGDTAEGVGELKLERLYIERYFHSTARVRAGKFFLPFGFWYRLHWHFLTETLSRPFSFHNGYAPKSQVGMQLFGKLLLTDETNLEYYAWVGDGPVEFGTTARPVATPGYGGSLFLTHDILDDFTVAVTAGFHGQQSDPISKENEYNVVGGIDLHLVYADLRGEYYQHIRSKSDDFNSFYGSVVLWPLVPLEIDNLGLVYRFDKGADDKHTKGATNHRAQAHSAGIIWKPHAQVLMKAEYRTYRFDDDTMNTLNEWNGFVALKF